MMTVRQLNILHHSSILLLLVGHVASITLSQFQEIQGFSNSCESVWQEDIPGCTKQDFTGSNSCSHSCLAGVNIINAEVIVACSDAQVESNTLLGKFLDGYGVSALCGETATTTSDVVTSPGEDSTTAAAATTTAGLVSSARTTTTAAESRGSISSTQSAQPSPQFTIPASSTSSSSSSTSSSTSVPNLTITFTGSTSTTSRASSSTSSTTSTSSKSDPEAKGFGGVGDAFDILGNENSAARLESFSLLAMATMAVMALSIVGGI